MTVERHEVAGSSAKDEVQVQEQAPPEISALHVY